MNVRMLLPRLHSNLRPAVLRSRFGFCADGWHAAVLTGEVSFTSRSGKFSVPWALCQAHAKQMLKDTRDDPTVESTASYEYAGVPLRVESRGGRSVVLGPSLDDDWDDDDGF